MDTDVYHVLLSDSLLAVVLFGLFWYVARLARGVRGIRTWGAAHLLYTLGTTLLDALSPALAEAGRPVAAVFALNSGALLACVGMVGLAWSIVLFTTRRALSRIELALMPAAVALSLAAWALDGTADGQGIALSTVEIASLGIMAWRLYRMRERPGRLPAWLMAGGCVALILLYGSVVPGWPEGLFGFDPIWVSADLSIWFMLNFCMLMLTSFRAAESWRHGAMHDSLTGLLNRRGLELELQSRTARLPADTEIATIALDLDRFKSVNDRYGHEAGDGVLQHFAQIVRACLPEPALFARLGGEEFVVVLTGADAASAQTAAERIRMEVAAAEFATDQAPIRVSCSLGVCSGGALRDSFADLLRTADQALYDAKRGGRDRVAVRLWERL